MLVFDRRTELGDAPMLHALVIGVSEYPNLPNGASDIVQFDDKKTLGLRSLSCAAYSACKIVQWLLDNRDSTVAPLGTVRLLLSPNEEERIRIASLPAFLTEITAWSPATLEALEICAPEWRSDANHCVENATWFYFCGHGFQTKTQKQALILNDFGQRQGSRLKHTVSIENIFTGMAPTPTFTSMAETQFYFVDSCRDTASGLDRFTGSYAQEPSAIWDVEPEQRDRRNAPVFYGTLGGVQAYSLVGQESVFCRALLKCLPEFASERIDAPNHAWAVTTGALQRALSQYFDTLSATEGGGQETSVSGKIGRTNAILLYHAQPPNVLLNLRMVTAPVDETQLSLFDERRNRVLHKGPPLVPHPYSFDTVAGFYTAEVEFPDNPVISPFVQGKMLWPPDRFPAECDWNLASTY